MHYAVVMAGGAGKRLWPLSREKRPKQVLRLLDGRTLLDHCFERLTSMFDSRNIIVLTNAGYADVVREGLPGLPFNNVIAEPAVRDTAGAIGLAATILTTYDSDATMAVVTTDQLIEPAEVLQQAIKDAIAFVDKNSEALITFGIKPTFASTQLGYIKCSNAHRYPCCKNQIYRVDSFKEKPDEETAKSYVDSGEYFWNSGMFVWKARTILENLKQFLPDAVEPLNKIAADWDSPNQKKSLQEWFVKLPKISIDFAVMEKAKSVYAIRLDCRWLDMGSFAALADVINSDGNNNIVVAGMSELLDCKDNIIITEDKGHLLTAIGLKNVIVAHTSDATLVCDIAQMDRMKDLLELLREHGREKYL